MCGFFSGQLNIAFFDLVGVLKHLEHPPGYAPVSCPHVKSVY